MRSMPMPSHVAILLPSVEKAAARLRSLGLETGPLEQWEGEGTKEIYIGKGLSNSLLLMEPYREGAYSHALEKRGPGLHHLAVDVVQLEAFLLALAGSGWLLHPRSVATIPKARTAYLARPGFPGLIEVQEKANKDLRDLFISNVELPLPAGYERLLAPIGLTNTVKKGKELKLQLGPCSILLSDLL